MNHSDLSLQFFERNGSSKPQRVDIDSAGGVVPQNVASARRVDLLTLPTDSTGAMCFNCTWVRGDGEIRDCTNPEVQQKINMRNHCARWSAEGVVRAWVSPPNSK